MCPRPPEKKATDTANMLIDVPNKEKANGHRPTGEMQGGERPTPPSMQINTTLQSIEAVKLTVHPGCKPRNDPPDKSQGKPEPNKEPPDQNSCNDDLQRSHHYKREAQPSRYSLATDTVTTFCHYPG